MWDGPIATGKFDSGSRSKRLLFNIANFNFSYNGYDSLTLYNRYSNTTQIIGKFCGQVNPPKMLSSSNEVLIHFETFHHHQMDGFKLEYQPSSKLPFPKYFSGVCMHLFYVLIV